MVHGESMVLEETSCQRHFVGGLNKTGAEVTHALLLISRHDIEGRSEELLTKALRCRETLSCLIVDCSIQVILDLFRLISLFAI